jgi:hypothetical protein
MIGSGGLESEIRDRIKRLFLNGQIDLVGFKDGEEKHKLFKVSRVILYLAVYDSGGMADCEGMAWGLPAVGFGSSSL